MGSTGLRDYQVLHRQNKNMEQRNTVTVTATKDEMQQQ